MDLFVQWAASTERSIVEAVHPGFDYTGRVTAGWPMTRLDHALYALAAYGILVSFGLVARASSKKVVLEKPTKQTPGLSESFSSEPIKYLIVVYNAVQVRELSPWEFS